MHYIITGAMGFVGQNIVKHINLLENSVIVIVRKKSKGNKVFDDRINVIYADTTESINLSDEKLRTPEKKTCIHFAWTGTSGDKRADERIQLENICFSCQIIRKAKEWNVNRFINAGSIMEYELLKTIVEEGKKPVVSSLYSIAKLSANYMMKTIAANIGIEYINIIVSNIYGPGDESCRFINFMIKKMLKNDSISLTDGKQLYDFIYIDDAIRMIFAVVEKGKAFESYYVGHDKQIPLRDFIIEAKETLHSKSELLFGEVTNLNEPLNYTEFETDKIYKLGAVPQISFFEGIIMTSKSLK